MPDKYFWAANYNLGPHSNPIEPGEELPASYHDDPRLSKWIKKGMVSTVKPSNEAKARTTIEKLEMKNLELQAQLNVQTDKLKAFQDQEQAYSSSLKINEKLNSHIDKLNTKINKLIALSMENEAVIADVVKSLREDRVDKKERLEAADLLEAMPKIGDKNEA